MSGQLVSVDKTSILFAKGVSTSMRRSIVELSGFKEVQGLGKYLGIPLTGRAPRVGDFAYLVESVKKRLSGWKASQLSFAGRVTLVKSVIEALPLYPMMATTIPKTCLREIQQLQRNFILGDSRDHRKFHAVNWNVVTKPKCEGGLGIRNLITMNEAYLMKITWTFQQGFTGQVRPR